jgi:major vault protein
VEVKVLQKRRAIPLSETEGIYIHDWKTGEIRMEMGVQSYMLQPHEDLWEKPLTEEVELLLKSGGGIGSKDIRKLQYFSDNASNSDKPRDPTRIVSFKAPGGTAVQVVDMKSRASRVVFGPELVILRPFEEFTILRYSAGKPKRPGALVSLCLLLGPDFITDVFEVETLDHARLSIKLAANVHFEFDKNNSEQVDQLFSVSDFIGDCAKMIASQVRSLVARTTFDVFHQNSSALISEAVFGKEASFKFHSNNLVISNIDVQNVKVADATARNLLQRSVQIAIDNTTKTMELHALNEAKAEEQESEGRIKREKYMNDAEAEKIRHDLIQTKLDNELINKTGSVKAVASAEAEVSRIEGEALVDRAKYKCEALEKINQKEDMVLQKKRDIEMNFKLKELELEMEREAQLAAIEASRFSSVVGALGPSTVKAISEAGNETKIKLLQSLGLEGLVVSNGRHPVNLERTANGMIGFS